MAGFYARLIYSSYLDEESRVQSGINYLQTLLYPLDTETGLYGEPVSIETIKLA